MSFNNDIENQDSLTSPDEGLLEASISSEDQDSESIDLDHITSDYDQVNVGFLITSASYSANMRAENRAATFASVEFGHDITRPLSDVHNLVVPLGPSDQDDATSLEIGVDSSYTHETLTDSDFQSIPQEGQHATDPHMHIILQYVTQGITPCGCRRENFNDPSFVHIPPEISYRINPSPDENLPYTS